jgi:hypothetical protein
MNLELAEKILLNFICLMVGVILGFFIFSTSGCATKRPQKCEWSCPGDEHIPEACKWICEDDDKGEVYVW